MLDTIELTLYRDDDKPGRSIRIVRAHITQWWPEWAGETGTRIRTTCGDTVHVSQDYALVTRLLTCDEQEEDCDPFPHIDEKHLYPFYFSGKRFKDAIRNIQRCEADAQLRNLDDILDPRD